MSKILVFFLFFHFQNAFCQEKDFFELVEKLHDASIEKLGGEINVQKSQQLARSAKLNFLPTVAVDVSRSKRYSESYTSLPQDSAGVIASLNLFKFGADARQLGIATAEVEIAKVKQKLESIKSKEKYAKLVLDYLRSKLEYENQQTSFALFTRSKKTTESLFQQGKKSRQDVSKIELDAIREENSLTHSKLDQESTLTKIAAILEDQTSLTSLPQQWPFERFLGPLANKKPTPLSLDSSPSLTIEMIHSRAKVLEKKRSNLYSRYFPTLNFTSEYRYLPTSTDKSLNQNSSWLLTLGVQIPLYSNDEFKNEIFSLSKDKELLDLEAHQLERSFHLEIKEKMSRAIELAKGTMELKKSLSVAQSLAEEAEKAFRYGRLSVNELVLDHSRVVFAKNAYIKSQYDFHLSMLNWCTLRDKELRECVENLL